jgi:hypothetical protein
MLYIFLFFIFSLSFVLLFALTFFTFIEFIHKSSFWTEVSLLNKNNHSFSFATISSKEYSWFAIKNKPSNILQQFPKSELGEIFISVSFSYSKDKQLIGCWIKFPFINFKVNVISSCESVSLFI